MSKPLATFCVTAYNQEAFVREAIEGAFAQTYSPLEILLSDDCSTDRTFEIMQEMAATYRGPHKVRLNRNDRNLGPAKHLSRQYELISGEFRVGSGGDDISLPCRMERLVDLWLRSGKRSVGIFSDAIIIDDQGQEVRPRNFTVLPSNPGDLIALSLTSGHATVRLRPLNDPHGVLNSWVQGSTYGYDKRLWAVFGGLQRGIIQEDVILMIRALLLGSIAYIDEPLVKYRRHARNVFPDYVEAHLRDVHETRIQEARVIMYQAIHQDIQRARQLQLVTEAVAAAWHTELVERTATTKIGLLLKSRRHLLATVVGATAVLRPDVTYPCKQRICKRLSEETRIGRYLRTWCRPWWSLLRRLFRPRNNKSDLVL